MPVDVVSEVVAELARHGLRGEPVKGRRHVKVYFHLPDGSRVACVCAASPSDWRSGKNCVAWVRRKLRAAGVATREEG